MHLIRTPDVFNHGAGLERMIMAIFFQNLSVCVCVCVCARVRVHACMHACVHVGVCVCERER